jgi:CRP-like cAMP-binding protein
MAASESKLWYLEQINLFKNLSEEEMMEIDQRAIMKSADKNQFIYFPKEPSKVIYFLKRGRVKIGSYSADGKEIIKTVLYPGEVFGEMGILGESNRRDFAVAMDKDTRLCTLSVEEMKGIMSSNSELSLGVTKLIGEKLRKMELKLESVIFKDARTRIVDLIFEMGESYGIKVGEETLIKHNLTHQDIANLTATSRQTVTTVLNELKEKDLIYMERNRFLVRDLNSLK